MDVSDFVSRIMLAQKQWSVRRRELDQLLAQRSLLLFGFGGKGRGLAHYLRQHCGLNPTIFDVSPERLDVARSEGFDCIDELPGNASQHWLTVLCACQDQIGQRRLVGGGYVYFQEACIYFDAPLLSHSASQFADYVHSNLLKLFEVSRVFDEEYRSLFLDVLCLRISGDPTYVQDRRSPVSYMWVDVPLKHKVREYGTILDVGAFDGDTLKQFRGAFNSARALAVEASADLIPSVEAMGAIFEQGLAVMPYAAWSRRTRLRFDEVRQGMISVHESPDGSLEAARIDDFFDEPVHFMKMDIEGAELEALRGASRMIKTFKPDLALAAYHKPSDFLELIDFVSACGYEKTRYKFALGHYSDCSDDTIVYACLR